MPSSPPSAIDETLARCLAESADIGALTRGVMAWLKREFEADRGSFFLIDPLTMSLRSEVAEGIDHALVVPLSIGVVGAAIMKRTTMRVDDAYAHPFFDSAVDKALGYRTRNLLVAPMISRSGRVLGCIEMLNKIDGVFSGEDEQKTVAAAARIARWIDDETIYPAGVEAEATAMRRSLGCERASVFSFDDRSNRLVSLYADGNDGRLLTLNVRLGIAGMVAISGQTILLRDAWEDARFDRTFDARTGYRTRSMLSVALCPTASAGLGVIQLINRQGQPFDEAQAQQLETIAMHIANAALRFLAVKPAA